MRPEQPYHLSQKLHTEMLEEKYGKISLQLLHDDDELREILLTDQQDIARTYAMTIRCNAWRKNREISAVHEAIRAGEPIGQAFKTRAYDIQKRALAVYTVRIPEWLRNAFMVEEIFGKTRITEFLVTKAGVTFQYGYVAEVYSPDFRKPSISLQDMEQVSIPVNSRQQARVDELKKRVSGMLHQIAPVLLFF